ncbi:hypothetical protein BJ165DRAFT_1597142 [Panaeolus papilionaceus]|nr:hypothetical protein BJ165DRAFT_1597142 [Panaeolus papilionaceus]
MYKLWTAALLLVAAATAAVANPLEARNQICGNSDVNVDGNAARLFLTRCKGLPEYLLTDASNFHKVPFARRPLGHNSGFQGYFECISKDINFLEGNQYVFVALYGNI